MYINGAWKDAAEHIDVLNPATGDVIGTVPNGGAKEAGEAADAAYEAFPAWSALTADERGALLMKWHGLIAEHADELARIMTTEQGKPLKEAAGEIGYANSFISWYAEEGKRVYGQSIPASSASQRIWVQKQPVGVVAAITPWNFPASMITRKVAPALAAGCTIVIKPSEETPYAALKLAELAHQAGLPAGVINVVTGEAAAIAGRWQQDERVRKISFTGSTAVGKELMKGAAETVKKISLELGGHAPFIVTASANLDKAVDGLIKSKFRNGGQTCVCTNRVYVDERIAGEFTRKAAERTAALQRIQEALYAAEALEYGIVGVNDPLPSTAQAPFGGFKQSGLGREGGHFGIEEYLEVKYVSLRL
ncbi:hypothetical protein BGX30_005526 [Mortierella sp. GBA39]|nr:hypothetical protein BGX30_005526 [Mortierella sp. GBA39]